MTFEVLGICWVFECIGNAWYSNFPRLFFGLGVYIEHSRLSDLIVRGEWVLVTIFVYARYWDWTSLLQVSSSRLWFTSYQGGAKISLRLMDTGMCGCQCLKISQARMLTKLRVYFPTPWFIAYENMPNPFPHAWSDGRSAHYQASLSEEFDIDDGPQTFTMQDHFDWLVSTSVVTYLMLTICDFHPFHIIPRWSSVISPS